MQSTADKIRKSGKNFFGRGIKKICSKNKPLYVGFFKEKGMIYQPDAVGAYNILRKHIAISSMKKEMSVSGLSDPVVIKVAV